MVTIYLLVVFLIDDLSFVDVALRTTSFLFTIRLLVSLRMADFGVFLFH